MKAIQFGPLFFPTEEGPEALDMAVKAEAWGYDSFWIPDYVTLPYMDPFVLAAAVAQATSRIRIGTAVVLAPLRTPFQLAKASGSVDRLSNGRFTLGVGVGALERDFEVAGVDFRQRGHICNETLDITRRLLTGQPVSYEGRYYRFQDLTMGPVPIQSRLPIWIGAVGKNGLAKGALRRAALYGDGFFPFETSVEEFQRAQVTIKELAAASGRDPDALAWGLLTWTCLGQDREDGARIASREIAQRLGMDWPVNPDQGFAVGTPRHMIETIRRYTDIGLTNFVIDPACPPSEIMDMLQAFAEKVIPHFRS